MLAATTKQLAALQREKNDLQEELEEAMAQLAALSKRVRALRRPHGQTRSRPSYLVST